MNLAFPDKETFDKHSTGCIIKFHQAHSCMCLRMQHQLHNHKSFHNEVIDNFIPFK